MMQTLTVDLRAPAVRNCLDVPEGDSENAYKWKRFKVCTTPLVEGAKLRRLQEAVNAAYVRADFNPAMV